MVEKKTGLKRVSASVAFLKNLWLRYSVAIREGR